MDQSRFIRGLLDDPRDRQLPQYDPAGGWNTAKNAGAFLASLTTPGAAADAAGYLGGPSMRENVATGDYGDAALQALGLIPGVGLLGKAGVGAKMAMAAVPVAKAAKAAKRASDLQELSSAGTSVRQVPGLFSNPLVELQPGYRNIDIGGGRFDDGTEFLRARGVDSSVYDPFNRSAEHNQKVMDAITTTPADMATVANVLNVIKEPEARKAVIQQAFDAIRPGGNAYFSVYGGDRSGVGAVTPKGWQENRLPPTYADEIASVFGDTVTRKGNVFKATRSQDSTTTGLLGTRD